MNNIYNNNMKKYHFYIIYFLEQCMHVHYVFIEYHFSMRNKYFKQINMYGHYI
jgi:hypothetical protein